eukprot:c40480_g1_i1.p1 GENE.c40480_g1_i1~~c40480_g1_i1.p1  ORF type:complete len:330 (+),score=34.84 c40480_g1_i1:140-991(+)
MDVYPASEMVWAGDIPPSDCTVAYSPLIEAVAAAAAESSSALCGVGDFAGMEPSVRATKRFRANTHRSDASELVSKSWMWRLYDELVDPLAGDRIGPEGVLELCDRLERDRARTPGYYGTGVAPLLLSWAVSASAFGYFKFSEFMAFEGLGVDGLEAFARLLDALLARVGSSGGGADFMQLYMYGFVSHVRGRRSIPADTAMRLWNVLLVGRYRVGDLFVNHFMPCQAEATKVISLDAWKLLPDFLAQCDTPCWMLAYKFDSPWPVLFDAFVKFAVEQNHYAG